MVRKTERSAIKKIFLQEWLLMTDELKYELASNK